MMMSRTYIATPPGETIKEQLEYRNMSQKEFSKRMDMSEKHTSKLINGDVHLTMDMAMRLEMVLGVPADFWCNLEIIYREELLKVKEENEMDEEIVIAKNFPYKEMANKGWVKDTRKWSERVINLRKFFEVAKLKLLNENIMPTIACRKLSTTKKSDYSFIAWVQKAKLESRKVETKSVNIKKLKSNINAIRKMTLEDPKKFVPELKDTLANCGIALILLPHMKGSFLHGATFYNGNKIVIGLTLRGKDADKFWFSLFHEIGHIILGHLNNKDEVTVKEEKEADNFSKDILIPSFEYKVYTDSFEINEKSILEFANKVDIAPGIVVGRLQKEKYIRYEMYNNLKEKYEYD